MMDWMARCGRQARWVLGAVALLCWGQVLAQGGLAEIAGGKVRSDVPRPDQVLGFTPGQRHIRHHELVGYLRQLQQHSDRVSSEVIGLTHEGRELMHFYITSAANQARLESLRQQHLKGEGPLVVWLGYSIHGNEASGSNVAPWVAWSLAAGEEAWLDELLENTIIILDPSLNPDGMDRFAQWTNAQAGYNPSADPADWEHTEPWPNGRTNHYWFDLNRDWLPLTQPESRSRISQFQRWRPHVLTDHHEMGSDATFFFQPGVPSRTNPITPALNQEITDALGSYHAQAFDQANALFFTREVFDDYYYGKGSTYPDAQGSVGILFEQASTRGKRVTSSYGETSFAQTMLNHYRASFSTLRGANDLREKLFDYRRQHDAKAPQSVGKGVWLVGDDGDPQRLDHFLQVLSQHEIEIYALAQAQEMGGQRFTPGHAYVIPRQQAQALLVEALFSKPTQFADESFYDVSAFTLALAYDLPHARLDKTLSLDERYRVRPMQPAELPEALAYVIPWGQMRAPGFMQQALTGGLKLRITSEPVRLQTTQGPRDLSRGSLLIATGLQDDPETLAQRLSYLQRYYPVEILPITQGRALNGPDLGSARWEEARQVKPLLVVGPGIDPYDAGEVWFTLDQNLGFTPTRVEWYRLGRVDLSQYTHVLMVDGNYSQLAAGVQQKLVDWVRDGGDLILAQGASQWSMSLPWGNKTQESGQKDENGQPSERRPYGEFEQDFAKRLVAGTIFNLDIDTTHPLGYGLQRGQMPMMKSNLNLLAGDDNPYAMVAVYAQTPVLAGYASSENKQALAGKGAIHASSAGRGHIIRFADNPLFRGHWLGSQRVYLNALMFSHMIGNTRLPETPR